MKKIAYFDCFSGISGDMCLGAIIDAGVDISQIKNELRKIDIKDYRIINRKVQRSGISATKVDVNVKPYKNIKAVRWRDIEELIIRSKLEEEIKKKGLNIFKRLFEIEAKVHGLKLEEAHLHELGGIDCIIDIFGTIIGLNLLHIEDIYVSPINLGSGIIYTSHGVLPVPAPATLELLKDYPIYSSDISFELTTPTGAAIISGLKANSSVMPEIKMGMVGYGAGNKDFPTRPNVLRLIVGEVVNNFSDDMVIVIETNIDDMNPQLYENVIDRLFEAGALDVFLENIIMKKSRPAIKLSVLSRESEIKKMLNIIFNETTTMGVRFYRANRKILPKEMKEIKTDFGDVKVKKAMLKDKTFKLSLEYEDLKKLAKKTEIPIKKLERLFKNYILK